MFAVRLLTTTLRQPLTQRVATTASFSTLRPLSPLTALRQTQQMPSLVSPTLTTSTNTSPILSQLSSVVSIFNNTLSLGGQRRWKARGNNFQPNTYKRKRVAGFLSRMRSKSGRKIIARRRVKGRWYLSY